MEFEDFSLWHHLISCEKLVIDAKEMESNAEEVERDTKEVESGAENNFVCSLCKKAVSGCPAYKCLECNFLIHASCDEMNERYHRSFKERHHLIHVEEGVNRREEKHFKVGGMSVSMGAEAEVVCLGCMEPASGPTYKCSFSQCPFIIHKSCAHLPHVICHHGDQPDHISTLQIWKTTAFLHFWERKRCDACWDWGGDLLSLFYHCSNCDFTIHMKCFSRLQISAEDHHQHALIPLPKPIPFTCQACGVHESQSRAYLCSVCRLLTHRDCGKFPYTIEIEMHNHSLTCTYSIPRVRKQDPIFCNLCYKKVNIEGGAYYCRQCDYIVHLKCASDCIDWRNDKSARINFNEYKAHMIHLVEGLNAREGETTSPSKINHFSHQQHKLILSYEEPHDEKRCEACMLFIIFAPFYSCQHCSFFLHSKCAKLPPTITRGPFHPHPLTILTIAPSTNVFNCGFCGHMRHGFTYACNKCWWWDQWDVQCLFIPETLNHKSHMHPLFLAVQSYEGCNGCGEMKVRFRCTDCQFNLCWKCVILPLVTRHLCDPHLLKLAFRCEDDLEEYYCFICEEKRNPNIWFYYCEECDLATHIQCVLGKSPHIKYGSTLHKENHQHPLKFVQITKGLARCDICNKEFRNGVALECTQCNIQIHYDCELTYSY